MAIVETYIFDGVTVKIDDSAFAGKSEEALARERLNAQRVAYQILMNNAMRERKEAEHGI